MQRVCKGIYKEYARVCTEYARVYKQYAKRMEMKTWGGGGLKGVEEVMNVDGRLWMGGLDRFGWEECGWEECGWEGWMG